MHSPDLPVYDATDQGIRLIEEERRRIARDLHDGPAQDLTNISMRLDVVRRLLQTDVQMAADELGRTNTRIITAINDIRRLIYDLRPVAIDEVGIVAATIEFCRRSERDWSIPILVSTDQETALDLAPAKQVAIYRLIQEALQNVHKHAQATEVQIAISHSSTHLHVVIRDNGVGFAATAIPDGHYGILGMKERVTFLGGELTIHSESGGGSELEFVIPYTVDSRPRSVHLP